MGEHYLKYLLIVDHLIIYWHVFSCSNARSKDNKLDEIGATITTVNQCDIVVIIEPRILPNISNDLISIPGFLSIRAQGRISDVVVH